MKHWLFISVFIMFSHFSVKAQYGFFDSTKIPASVKAKVLELYPYAKGVKWTGGAIVDGKNGIHFNHPYQEIEASFKDSGKTYRLVFDTLNYLGAEIYTHDSLLLPLPIRSYIKAKLKRYRFYSVDKIPSDYPYPGEHNIYVYLQKKSGKYYGIEFNDKGELLHSLWKCDPTPPDYEESTGLWP